MPQVIGVIPARGGSKSIPRKNMAMLRGKPMIDYTIDAAHASKRLSRVLVSTDDAEFAKHAVSRGVESPFLRPPELAGDTTPMMDVLKHLLAWLDANSPAKPDAIMLLQPTSPMRQACHIDAAVDLLFERDADCVVSVMEVPHQFSPASLMKLDAGRLLPFLNDESSKILRRQDKPLVYARNGPAVLTFKADLVREGRGFYSGVTLPLVMDAAESIDVDGPFELELAEFLMSRRAGK